MPHQRISSRSGLNRPVQRNLLNMSSIVYLRFHSNSTRRQMNFEETTMKVNSRIFRLNFAELENAILAFFFEDRMRLGTVAIAMPGSGEVAVGRSSVLLGGKYMMTTRALAEKIAGRSGRMALVSLFTELNETEALRIYSKLLDKASLPLSPEDRTLPGSSI